MRDRVNIEAVAALRPDMMGFIFYAGSPRYAGTLAPEVVKSLPEGVTPIGLFVNSSEDEMMSISDRYGITTLQLHGDESPELCRRLKNRGYQILKAFGVDESTDWDRLLAYDGAADYLVLDSKSAAWGGSGRKFDWQLLKSHSPVTPFLLSGGIGPDDTEEITAIDIPSMAGVDVNSRFELSPGMKDVNLLSRFINSIRKNTIPTPGI